MRKRTPEQKVWLLKNQCPHCLIGNPPQLTIANAQFLNLFWFCQHTKRFPDGKSLLEQEYSFVERFGVALGEINRDGQRAIKQ